MLKNSPGLWGPRNITKEKLTRKIVADIIHKIPKDFQKALTSDSGTLVKWNTLTPIQRNEWICFTTLVKKPETRAEHIKRMIIELKEGKRKPCCWPGCPHRSLKVKII